MTTTVEKNKTAVHVGGTGDSPYRAAFQAVEAHTHTLQTVSCIVSRGPSHNLHSQTATVLMPFQYANFRLRVSVLFFCIHIYIPSSPRFGEKKNVPQTSPSFEWCIQDHTQNNLAIEKKKKATGQDRHATSDRTKFSQCIDWYTRNNTSYARTHQARQKTNANIATAYKCASRRGGKKSNEDKF